MSWNFLLFSSTVPWTLCQNLRRVPRKRALWPFPAESRWPAQTIHTHFVPVGSWGKLKRPLFPGEEPAAYLFTYSSKNLPDIYLPEKNFIPEWEGKQSRTKIEGLWANS